MKKYALVIPLLLAACGNDSGSGQVATTAAPFTTTTTPPSTMPATTTTVAPTTTVDREERIQIIAIENMFTAQKRVDICLMQLNLSKGGFPEDLIVDLGFESFAEGFGDLTPKAEKLVRDILWGCFR